MTLRQGKAAGHIGAALVLALVSGACGDAPGERLLVTSGFTDQIFVLDARTGEVIDSLSLDRRPGERDEPHAVAVSPDGAHFYATLSHGEPSLWKYETEGLRLVGRLMLPTNGASRVRLSPDGSLAAVPDYWLSGGGQPSRVAFVRTEDMTLVASPELCAAPHDASFSPDGSQVAVTCTLSDELVLLSAEDFQEIERYSMSNEPGARPLNTAWMPDGRQVLVTLMGRGSYWGLPAANSEGARPGDRRYVLRVETGEGPAQIAVSPDGSSVVVANRRAGSVTVTEASGARRHQIQVSGAHPHGVAFGSDAGVVYVTYEGDTQSFGGVVAIDVRTGAVLWDTEVGSFTLGVAVLPPPRG